MQSGISASQELHTALQTLLTSTTQRGLLATIKDEQIVPTGSIDSASDSFTSDLSNLTPHIQPNQALYILLRLADSLSSADKSLAAITYVPNAAPVRQKMLFASTRLTLTRDLGGEHFSESVFCTEPDDLTAAGWERHMKHTASSAPLTEDERRDQEIREAEALESGGTQGKSLVQGGRIAMRADDEIASALNYLGTAGAWNLVQLRMDAQTETLHLASTSTTTPATLGADISGDEPRFSFYRHDAPGTPSPERAASGVIVFISTCPSKARIKERMLYAASRGNVIKLAQEQGGLKVAKRIEATNPDEVTEQVIADEFKVEAVVEKKGFAKPKRPGRR